ncbi:uncharacterized protein V1516DRAFT_620576 [Lipomyces oligophaga]|uniref:uncharacterized protein n=1 Tax=Lipomyces oligophaga TaxID=45792 RepID=UPI0034CFC84E
MTEFHDSKLYYDPQRDDEEGESLCRGPLTFAEIILKEGRVDPTPFLICADQDSEKTTSSSILCGCDGEKGYSFILTDSSADYIREQTNELPKDEWSSLLRWIFLRKNTFTNPSAVEKYQYPKIFLSARKTDRSYEVTIDYHHEKFVTILGRIKFTRDDNIAFSAFRLCADSIRSEYYAQIEHNQLRERLEQYDSQLKALQSQMEEFLEEKTRSDLEMMEKVRNLLNEKKSRIYSLTQDALEDDLSHNETDTDKDEQEQIAKFVKVVPKKENIASKSKADEAMDKSEVTSTSVKIAKRKRATENIETVSRNEGDGQPKWQLRHSDPMAKRGSQQAGESARSALESSVIEDDRYVTIEDIVKGGEH